MDQNEKKRQAAIAALKYIPEGAQLGVGTGSTVNFFIDALPEVRSKISKLVASSEATRERLEKLDFEVVSLAETGDLDLYVDGADEANKHFHLIKGGGGALTREKVIAGAAHKFVCIVDDTKPNYRCVYFGGIHGRFATEVFRSVTYRTVFGVIWRI